jgi:hypothetical protein
MKKILILLLLSPTIAFASDTKTVVYENDTVYCVKFLPTANNAFGESVSYDAGVSISCLSKISIEKDKLELEVLKLQKSKLEKELSQKNK